MDVALGHTSGLLRKTFIERRARWGGEVRIVDLELASMNMPDERSAVIEVDVAWVRVDDGTLRTTRIAQVWRDEIGGWKLTREKRVTGDLGLFGEPVKMVRIEPRNVQFATKTIR
jgi:hypothetical protein